ncbi:MAG: flagellar motor stator protein MotA [Rhodospirillales bacterium CG15_BIG_FIL_POST_REV_8_21_14_020_66_15]|nr:MAG: flagellar motor stator protein MotA [Rhodospirillales bacterium CG15_BIG_FIL_POST_REV_8_21_14_020_66_15]
MLFIVGSLVVLVCVFGAYGVHGSYAVLWQPLEFIIIFGGAIGAFITGNPKSVLKGTGSAFKFLLKGPNYTRAHYEELLGCLYSVFRLAKTKGDLALEAHVEKPDESTLFANFPLFHGDHHAVEFLCDYLRLLTLGASNPHEIESVMDAELEKHHEEQHAIAAAFQSMADATPALGIVAAVLGVIVTMGSITEPPEVLGNLIAAALVGTFSGILISYGFVAPMAASLTNTFASDAAYLNCIKIALVGHMQGYAPQVSVEFARKTLSHGVRPTFAEVEEMVTNLPSAS